MKRKAMHKKGQVFGQLGALGVGIATLAIVLVVTFLIISQGRDQIQSIEGFDCDNFSIGAGLNSAACNATATLQEAVADVPPWIPLVVIAVIGAVLLSLVRLFGR